MPSLKNNFFYSLTISLLVILFAFTDSRAQVSFYLSTEQEYNDNPFRSSLPTKSFISSFEGGLEFDLGGIELGYYGNYINFDVIPERNYYWHQAAIWKNFENSTIGFFAEQRINKTDYNYFDYTNITGYYQTQFETDGFYFSLTPNLSLTKYNNISILDNFKASLNYSINHGFETGTTLIFGGGLNFKKYLDPVQTGTFSYYDENNLLIQGSYTDKNVSSLTQILTYGRIAQSLTPTTGLAAQFTNRSIVNGFANQIKDLNMVYGDESEIFDDPVNYEGNGLAFELTQVLGESAAVKAGYYLNKKSYPSQGTYDALGYYDTGIMRTDTQNLFNLSIKKNFALGESEESTISVGLNYQYINNKSNSYWFNYTGNSVNLSFGFQL